MTVYVLLLYNPAMAKSSHIAIYASHNMLKMYNIKAFVCCAFAYEIISRKYNMATRDHH